MSSKPAPRAEKVAVIGLGNWGTALGCVLAERGHTVIGWSRDPKIVSGINDNHKNPTSLPAVLLPPRFAATGSLEQAISGATAIFLVLPSSALPELASQLAKITFLPDAILVSAIKGFDSESKLTPLQFMKGHLKPSTPLVVLSGPSFAEDVICGNPAGIVAASENSKAAAKIASLFGEGGALKIYVSDDPFGVEIGGAVKNVIALAAGISDGIGLGESAKAAIITRGLAEISRLGKVLGAKAETFSGLSGLGDLVMTATSNLSRNRTAGLMLGRGERLESVLSKINSVVEGVRTAPIVLELGRQHKVELPIVEQVVKLLKAEVTPGEVVKTLLSRPIKKEGH